MATAKVAITVDRETLRLVDRWVQSGQYASRSQAIQAALREKLERWRRVRLTSELAKLSPEEERAVADESLLGEAWPPF